MGGDRAGRIRADCCGPAPFACHVRLTPLPLVRAPAAFSVTRFRGDEKAAKDVYKGLEPLVAEDIAEDIVFAASRKPHMLV